MGDPERLLKSGTADPEVYELLQSLRGIAPEARRGAESWAAMAAKVATLPTIVPAPGSAPLGASAPASTGAAGVSHALALKLLAVAVASTVVGVGGYWAHTAHQTPRHAPNASSAPALASPPASLPVPAAVSDRDAPAPLNPANGAQANGAASSGSAGAHVSRLEAEASLLAKVRSELRNGQPHAALVTLNQLQSSFPNGELRQEREVLAVEVLAANGNTAAAKRKANAFIAAHPSSPHSAKLERFVDAR